jgi:hypothetical protein
MLSVNAQGKMVKGNLINPNKDMLTKILEASNTWLTGSIVVYKVKTTTVTKKGLQAKVKLVKAHNFARYFRISISPARTALTRSINGSSQA